MIGITGSWDLLYCVWLENVSHLLVRSVTISSNQTFMAFSNFWWIGDRGVSIVIFLVVLYWQFVSFISGTEILQIHKQVGQNHVVSSGSERREYGSVTSSWDGSRVRSFHQCLDRDERWHFILRSENKWKKQNQTGSVQSTAPSHDDYENPSFLQRTKAWSPTSGRRQELCCTEVAGGLHELLTCGLGADAGVNRKEYRKYQM